MVRSKYFMPSSLKITSVTGLISYKYTTSTPSNAKRTYFKVRAGNIHIGFR